MVTTSLSPRMPAEEAVRAVLLRQLEAMLRNEGGVAEDADPEFLHDFRVAVRRSRSCLGQLKKVFPADGVRRFRRDLAWLGSVSGPTRDLDVFLLDLERYRRHLSAAEIASLEPLEALVREERRGELETLLGALRGERYAAFVRDWGEYLRNPQTGGAHGEAPILDVAGPRATRGLKKMVEAGRSIDPRRDGEALHRLRVRGKKVRYLLEFFRDVLDREKVEPTIRALKKLQNVLGEFNDLQVQQAALREYAAKLPPQPDTLLTLGRLIERLARLESRCRRTFVGAFEEFVHAVRSKKEGS